MTDLTLTLLGGYRGSFGDGPELMLPDEKGWALLSYLALQPDQPVSRETLAALLWGERLEEQARGSLQQTLHELHAVLGDDLADRLTASRTTVSLSGNGIGVDALRFEELVKSGTPDDLFEAEALYRGPLLEGLEIGEPGFTEWLEGMRAHYQNLAGRGLEVLASVMVDSGDYDGALAAARRLVAIEPLRESAHRLLMLALAAAGRRSEALKHYQDLAALLRRELNAEPNAETRKLRATLADEAVPVSDSEPADEPAPAPDPAPAPSAAATRRPPWAPRALAAAAVIVLALGLGLALWQPWAPGVRPVSPGDMAYPLPDKPSIAVLPFENLSGERQDDFISSGLTEDVITALSKLPQLFVISRTSSFAFEDQSITAPEIAQELGVRYILEGSIRRSGNTLRISAQLVDAVKGHDQWAESFDGAATDLFALQDDLVRRIVVQLQGKLTSGDQARVASRGTANLDAWLLREQAMAELFKFTRESTVRTRELFQQAHEADPNWARPLGGLAFTYWFEARRGWTDDRVGWIREGIALAERCIEVDPREPLCYMQLGNLHQLMGNDQRAIALREKAVAIAPNDFLANWGLGSLLFRAGQTERAVAVLKHAERLSPYHPASFTWTLSQAQLIAGHYEDAIETAKWAVARAPERDEPRIQLAAAYSALDRMDSARREAQELLRITPDFTVTTWKSELADYRDRVLIDKIGRLLVAAGLPE